MLRTAFALASACAGPPFTSAELERVSTDIDAPSSSSSSGDAGDAELEHDAGELERRELADAGDAARSCDLSGCTCGSHVALCCMGPCPPGFEGLSCYCGDCLFPKAYDDAGACR